MSEGEVADFPTQIEQATNIPEKPADVSNTTIDVRPPVNKPLTRQDIAPRPSIGDRLKGLFFKNNTVRSATAAAAIGAVALGGAAHVESHGATTEKAGDVAASVANLGLDVGTGQIPSPGESIKAVADVVEGSKTTVEDKIGDAQKMVGNTTDVIGDAVAAVIPGGEDEKNKLPDTIEGKYQNSLDTLFDIGIRPAGPQGREDQPVFYDKDMNVIPPEKYKEFGINYNGSVTPERARFIWEKGSGYTVIDPATGKSYEAGGYADFVTKNKAGEEAHIRVDQKFVDRGRPVGTIVQPPEAPVAPVVGGGK